MSTPTFGHPRRRGGRGGDKHQMGTLRSGLYLEKWPKGTADQRLQWAFLVSNLHRPVPQQQIHTQEIIGPPCAAQTWYREGERERKTMPATHAAGERRANTSRSPPLMSSRTLQPSHVTLLLGFGEGPPSSSPILPFYDSTPSQSCFQRDSRGRTLGQEEIRWRWTTAHCRKTPQADAEEGFFEIKFILLNPNSF